MKKAKIHYPPVRCEEEFIRVANAVLKATGLPLMSKKEVIALRKREFLKGKQ